MSGSVAFQQLTARRRQAAELRAPPNNMTLQQIADKMGVSVSAVHAYLKTAALFGYDAKTPTRYKRRNK